ncbi:hypothetical protein [Oceanispirochaeta crateris]|jgi:hypothetical protein|nr:hypothetical protein [Oceanispirochaeta crateris]
MFWKRILSAVMLALGMALIFRSLLNLIPVLRNRKKDKKAESGDE